MDSIIADIVATLTTPAGLAALGQVIMIDLVLAGDNAIVIGLAAAGLPADVALHLQTVAWETVQSFKP